MIAFAPNLRMILCFALLGLGLRCEWGMAAPQPSLENLSEGCENYVKELAASDFVAGWLSVPESDSNPIPVHIFYYYREPLNEKVILFLNGGPSLDSHGIFGYIDDRVRQFKLDGQISFVYMDQRGTGCSSPYPQGSDLVTLERLTAYGSRGIVADAEALRKELLGPQSSWRVFGQSFGAFVAHRYVALHPESLQKVFAHGGVLISDPVQRLADRVYSQHRVLNLYLEKYPKDALALKTLYWALTDQNFCFENSDEEKLCGHSLIEPLVAQLTSSQRWSRLHQLITSMVRINPLTNTWALSPKDIEAFVRSYSRSQNPSASWAVSVLNTYDRKVIAPDFEACQKAHKIIEEQYQIKIEEILLSECLSSLQFRIQSTRRPVVEDYFGVRNDFLSMKDFRNGVLRMAPNSFFLYSGERDCLVPKESFLDEVKSLFGLIAWTHFPFSGHEGYLTEFKLWKQLASQP